MRSIEELIEELGIDTEIVKSFNVKDTLSSDIFSSNKMKEDVREKLLEITNEFLDFMDIDFFVYDIVLTGSLSNYNWSKFSDVDLHILIDFDEFDAGKVTSSSYHKIIVDFFQSKRGIWNSTTDIKIKGFEVEIYVQDVDEEHMSSGVYSILNGEWVIEPTKLNPQIDPTKILEKGEEYAKLIDDLIKRSELGEDVIDSVSELKLKIKKFRQSGLERGGEFSYENLTFKLLRRNGYIGKLINIKTANKNKKLSLPQ